MSSVVPPWWPLGPTVRRRPDRGVLGELGDDVQVGAQRRADLGVPEDLHGDTGGGAVPNVIQAQRLFGDPDYLLQVIARDLPAFQQIYDEQLSTLPGVQRLTSTLVMKRVVEDQPLPL